MNNGDDKLKNAKGVADRDDASIKIERLEGVNANLEKTLEKERDARREDWFLFVLISLIGFDFTLFSTMENWGAPIALLIMEVILLVILARRLGRDEISKLVSDLLNRFAPHTDNNEDQKNQNKIKI